MGAALAVLHLGLGPHHHCVLRAHRRGACRQAKPVPGCCGTTRLGWTHNLSGLPAQTRPFDLRELLPLCPRHAGVCGQQRKLLRRFVDHVVLLQPGLLYGPACFVSAAVWWLAPGCLQRPWARHVCLTLGSVAYLEPSPARAPACPCPGPLSQPPASTLATSCAAR